jgi:seryl-tRNA(Sec) selenium transferase
MFVGRLAPAVKFLIRKHPPRRPPESVRTESSCRHLEVTRFSPHTAARVAIQRVTIQRLTIQRVAIQRVTIQRLTMKEASRGGGTVGHRRKRTASAFCRGALSNAAAGNRRAALRLAKRCLGPGGESQRYDAVGRRHMA